jgi:hypothetical protein
MARLLVGDCNRFLWESQFIVMSKGNWEELSNLIGLEGEGCIYEIKQKHKLANVWCRG